MDCRAHKKTIQCADRIAILDVYKQIKKCHPEENVTFWVRKTSEMTAVSQRSIYRFRKEESKGQMLIPRKTRRNVEYQTSRRLKYDGYVTGTIIRKVESFFAENSSPTLSSILQRVNDDPKLPTFKRTTLWRLLKENGFLFEKNHRRSILSCPLKDDRLKKWNQGDESNKVFDANNQNIDNSDTDIEPPLIMLLNESSSAEPTPTDYACKS
ncbi:tRNA (guanine(37)-N1)-methyltransferase [Homalodisca vitripennis]|nr:tRNA (guanine(37)-N1)-methyltransferase [Homalodisca vitripennis]